MKLLEMLFDRTRPWFEKDGRLHLLRPLAQGAEAFFFGSAEQTHAAPHARDPLDSKRFMMMVIIALTPALLASIYFFGLRVLVMMAVSYIAGGIVEVAFAIIRKKDIHEGFFVTGFLFPLVVPPTTPLWVVAVGVVFGVLVGKEVFGGTGRNLFNPVLVGRAFLAVAYPAQVASGFVIPGAWPWGRLTEYVTPGSVDALSGATPLALGRQGEFANWLDMFLGNISGSAGETSALAILLGGLFLCMTRVANYRTVAGILGAVFVFSSLLHVTDPARFGPPLWHLFAGGLFLGAFFMATDPVTSPATNTGKWVYGMLIGALVVLIRSFSGWVEGVMFAILLGNLASPLIDEIFVTMRVRRLQREG
ncbi:MAG: RnfABCDGE type electron transport complex subunit D [Thermoguttaceae bacterium]|nr:RnfABCDGE type electron transport complex subunit D [Thermoguttaceae bacterium]